MIITVADNLKYDVLYWPLVVKEEHNVLSLAKDLAIACDVVSITIFCHFLHYCFVFAFFFYKKTLNC
jgi:hypothetical protein